MKKKKTLHLLLLLLISILLSGAYYIKTQFSITNFDEVFFSLFNGSGGADSNIFITSALRMLKTTIPIFIFLYALFYDITFGKKKLYTKKGIQLYPLKVFNKDKKILTVALLIASLIILICSIGVPDYVTNLGEYSSFIEDNYVDPKDVKISFNEKRNIIFIMVESLETTFFTTEQGGYWEYDLIPELYELQNEDKSFAFYNKDKIQQTNMIRGSSWTTASVVSSLSGVPIKEVKLSKTFDKDHFFNNVYSFGDLLKDNGYHNELISGARVSFGGIEEYFTNHGNYEIIDESNLTKYGFNAKDSDYGKWGINDNYLFEIAKKRLEKISKEKEPFNMQLITIDTHFIDGYVGNYSFKKYNTQYENAFATESELIYEFVKWVQDQDFYKNTTIVIAGDHLTMQSNVFKGKNIKNRYVYNCFINPRTADVKNSNRIITALDYYPTMVYAIGGDIENNRLGLGVNLFSKEKTLSEKHTFNYVYDELNKNSKFYKNKIMDNGK